MSSALRSSRQSVPTCEGNEYDSSQNIAPRNKGPWFHNKLMVGLKRTPWIPVSIQISSGSQLESRPRTSLRLLGERSAHLRAKLGPTFGYHMFQHLSEQPWMEFKRARAFYPRANEILQRTLPRFYCLQGSFPDSSPLAMRFCKTKPEPYKTCPVSSH